jgi:hypothetical protein
MPHEIPDFGLNILFQLGTISDKGLDVFSKGFAVILLTSIRDFLERVSSPILEVAYMRTFWQSIKNMVKAIEDCRKVDQSKCFTVLTLQLHIRGEIADRLFV